MVQRLQMFNLSMIWTNCVLWLLAMGVAWPALDAEPVFYGNVQSPLYPSPYPPNLQHQWDLSVPEGYRVSLTFTHLDIEASVDCYYDSLTILYEDRVLGKFCGQDSSDGHHPGTHPILSPGNTLTLVMQTDDGNPEKHQNVGFSAHYQAIDVDECSDPELNAKAPVCSQVCLNTLGAYHCSCHHGYELRQDQRTCRLSCLGGIFDEPTGHLTSPGHPHPPTEEVSCQYIISVEAGFRVTLNFSDHFHVESMETEEGQSCPYHWLQVTVGEENPVKYCGTKSPGLMVLNSNTVQLDYYTDDKGLSNGWSLDYTTERVTCAPPGAVAKGRVTPALKNYFYRDYVFVRCDTGHKLMMNGKEIKSFAAMCQNNGQWHLPLPECHLIDCGEPAPLLNGGVTFVSGEYNQYGSVVQYRCNEPYYTLPGAVNVSFSCEADRKWRSVADGSLIPICLPVCGKPRVGLSGFQKIIGGKAAPQDSIPWQVRISGSGGGMVIGDRWVLTAAHVLSQNNQLRSPNDVEVYWGTIKAENNQVSNAIAQSLHLHPKYNNSGGLNFDNDIALIKLPQPITFNQSVMPLCLPSAGETLRDGINGVTSGFGLTTDSAGSHFTSNRLKYVKIPVVNQTTCRESLEMQKTKSPREEFPEASDNMFCAGVPQGGMDSCQGDSGGPFAVLRNNQYWATGIVSWGVNCGEKGTYGFYTKVANYVDWIHKVMGEN